MTPIEIFAFIAAIAGAVKILVLLIKPKVWLDSVVKKVYKIPVLTAVISLALSLAVLYYLLEELTITQIFAVMLFIALLAAISIAAYSKEMVSLAEKLTRDKKPLKKAWLAILIWIVLIIWVLYTLLA